MRWIFGSTIGSILSVIVVTILTIVADLEPRLKDWLKAMFGHHWVGKGIITLIVFVIVSLMVAVMATKITEKRTIKAINALIATSILAAITLLIFFLFETLY